MSENTTTNAKTFAERAATDPTALHKAFAEWIKANTGYDADLKTVQIVCAMRMDIQRSEENQNSLKARKEEAAKAKAEAAAKKKAKLLAELAQLEADAKAETQTEAPAAEEPAKATEEVKGESPEAQSGSPPWRRPPAWR